jgi:hypothetical protein
MMPRLEARERIDRAKDIALGNGALEDDAARDLIEQLQEQARGPLAARRATARDLAGAGIGVRVSPPSSEGGNDG